ncbi:MAG: alpha/beta hydrolase [Defluviitaleaceae bacterium]|nr:alpha/beta hydrolase [Defluviitaleaceae bacterium]
MMSLVKDVPVFYEEYGEGKPILCIHGYTLDHRMMSGCMEPIFEQTQGYRRIYLDLPGMGKTPSAKWIKNGDNMLEAIIEFINTIIPNEKFLIAGESYGGYMTLGLIHKMPDKIDGVLLICPQLKSWVMQNIEKEKLPKKQLLWVSEDMPSEEVNSDIKDFRFYSVIESSEIFNTFKSDILPGIKLADRDFLYNYYDGAYSHDFEAGLRIMEFTKPACILTGRQDIGVGYRDAYEMLDRFPRATFAVLDCAGHNLQIENEPVFTQMIKDWIWRLELKTER